MLNEVDAASKIAFNKEMFIAIPILGSAIAIIFDVGYFTGIELNFFTFFSLNEHIVFAFEALPAAIVAASLVGVVLTFSRSIEVHYKKQKGRWILSSLGVLCFVGGLVGLLFFGFYWSAISGLFSGFFLYMVTDSPNAVRRGLFAVILVTITAYCLGHHTARTYLLTDTAPTATIHRKTDQPIQAKIIRSGDRGVLYYDQVGKQVSLLRWD